MAAAADGQMLGLIFFSLLFGFFMTKIVKVYAENLYNFWQSIFQMMMKITDWVMRFAPISVFGLAAKVVESTGVATFIPLAWFFQCAGGIGGTFSGGVACVAIFCRAG